MALAVTSASGQLAESHGLRRACPIGLRDRYFDRLAVPERRQCGGEIVSTCDRLAVDRVDRVPHEYSGLFRWARSLDCRDHGTWASEVVREVHAECGAMRVDHASVSHDLAGDVLHDVAGDREPDTDSCPAGLR